MRYLIAIAAVGSLAVAAEVDNGYARLSEEEMRDVLYMRDVQIPVLEAEVRALRLELQACQEDAKLCDDNLAWCEAWRDKPLNRPAVNLLAGFGACAAVCAAAR